MAKTFFIRSTQIQINRKKMSEFVRDDFFLETRGVFGFCQRISVDANRFRFSLEFAGGHRMPAFINYRNARAFGNRKNVARFVFSHDFVNETFNKSEIHNLQTLKSNRVPMRIAFRQI